MGSYSKKSCLGYTSGNGCSGSTYQGGVREAAKRTNPALVIFENVIGVAESTRDGKGIRQEPAVQAGRIWEFHDVYST